MVALVGESQSKLKLLRGHAGRRVVHLRRVGAGRQDRRRGGQHPAQVVGTNAQVLHLVRAKEQAAAQIYGAGADGKHHWKRRQHQKLSEDGTMRYGWRSKDIKRCVMMVASAIDQDWVQIDSEGIVNFCLCVFSLRKTVEVAHVQHLAAHPAGVPPQRQDLRVQHQLAAPARAALVGEGAGQVAV